MVSIIFFLLLLGSTPSDEHHKTLLKFLPFLGYLARMNALSLKIMDEDLVTDVAKHDIMAASKKIKCM